MKILILGAYNSVNLGDAVICECVAHMVQKHFPDAQISICDLIDRKRRPTSSDIGIKTLEQRRIRTNIRRFSSRWLGIDLVLRNEAARSESNRAYLDQVCHTDCDLVIFAGGQMYMDMYALFLEQSVLTFQERGIPVIFNACGTGPTHSRTIRNRLKHVLMMDCVKYLSCRDDVDKLGHLFLEPSKKVVSTYDPALITAKTYQIPKDISSNTIGLGVMYPTAVSFKKSLRFWQNIIRNLESQKIQWKIFTNGAPSDEEFAKEILRTIPELHGREAELLCPRPLAPEDLIKNIASFEKMISFRLHSHIIAHALGIPSVAMVWDDKVPFFFKKIKHPERCFSLNTAATQVLATLQNAQTNADDALLLENQAQHTEHQLIDAIRRCLS